MEIATIGFTKTSAEAFFEALQQARVKRLLDTRAHNTSQLAGFTKVPDFAFFLDRVAGITYEHDLRLAPTPELLSAYRSRQINWNEYEEFFKELLRSRNVPADLDSTSFDRKTALLCSEASPRRCHRRLVAELLSQAWGARIEHL